MIVFDFDGVLSDSTLWYEDVCKRICSTRNLDYSDLLGWMIEHGNRSWLSGTWSDEHFVEALNRAFDTNASLEEVELACVDSMRLSPEVMELVKPLGSLTIFTDNPRVRVRVMERTLPVPSRITCSQDAGAKKHNDFSKFVEASGVREGLYVDDYRRNVEAAAEAGFETLKWQLGENSIEELDAAIRAAR